MIYSYVLNVSVYVWETFSILTFIEYEKEKNKKKKNVKEGKSQIEFKLNFCLRSFPSLCHLFHSLQYQLTLYYNKHFLLSSTCNFYLNVKICQGVENLNGFFHSIYLYDPIELIEGFAKINWFCRISHVI